jgi:hypothetical protein
VLRSWLRMMQLRRLHRRSRWFSVTSFRLFELMLMSLQTRFHVFRFMLKCCDAVWSLSGGGGEEYPCRVLHMRRRSRPLFEGHRFAYSTCLSRARLSA